MPQSVALLLLMLAAPFAAIAIETLTTGTALVPLIGKWFVFFFGLRLLLAGGHQATKSDFTAKTIFRITDPNASKIVSELGFANIAMGAFCALTILNAAWVVPGAIVLAIFYSLAGGKHVLNTQRTSPENWAMWSDLWAGLLLATWLAVR